jgi:hypothetical protein
MLILKRDPDAIRTEGYDVLFEGRYVGRIYKAVSMRRVRLLGSGGSIFLSGKAAMGRSTVTPRH